MVASVVLLPNDQDIAALRQQSRALLGDIEFSFWPHITVVQFETDISPVALAAHIAVLDGMVREAQGEGLAFVPRTDADEIWMEVTICKTLQFMRLQEQIASHDYFSLVTLRHPIGDPSRPHITVGRVTAAELAAVKLVVDPEVVRKRFTDLQLAVALNDSDTFTITELVP